MCLRSRSSGSQHRDLLSFSRQTRSVATLTRRQALGIGAAVTAGTIGVPLVGYEVVSHTLLGSNAGAGNDGWPSPLGSPRARAAHLLRRAGFAPSSADLDAAQSVAYGDLVEAVVSQQPDPLPAVADVTNSSDVIGTWYRHMATTRAQFPERMTLFWHGLLTSDRLNAAQLPLVLQQNTLYRENGLGDLRSLLIAVTYDPLMMRYLNLSESTAAAPNENYSRELMELFTLGAGNYSESDVRDGARALSGLRIVAVDADGTRVKLPPSKPSSRQQYAQEVDAMYAAGMRLVGRLAPRQHDSGSKTYLGRTGNLGPEDVIDTILAQPACAQHIAQRALSEFCMVQPPAATVTAVAAQFRNSGYDIRTLMRAVFSSDAFVSSQSYRMLARSPAQYTVAVMRLLNAPQLTATAARMAVAMGQDLYNPPNVGGWPLNRGWISSGAWLARLNFAAQAVDAQPSLPSVQQAVQDQLDSVLTPTTQAALQQAGTQRDAWYALLASPEFHLL
jgi:uncharacterized protein (DUF1800 family)